jgi:hypothetical protein
LSESNTISRFVDRWKGVSGSERANYQLFITELCDVLDLPSPDPASEDTRDNGYVFERRIEFSHGDGTVTNGFIDCYRRGSFVLEAKKIRKAIETKGFDDALMRARAQGEGYARALPAPEGRPPFVIVVDVGHIIEIYSEFTRTGATYTPYPDPRRHRITLDQLHDDSIRDRLRKLWLEPMALDPARISAKVTRDVAVQLAEVAVSLEATGHTPHDVAAFLTRCLFCMFAEDVELLPRSDSGEGAFVDLLTRFGEDPQTLRQMMRHLWRDMDKGGFSAALARKLLRFNGKLFKDSESDSYVLTLSRDQVDGLRAAAHADWREVEPAIFGTLLERALDPIERHALGAHYTPRSYVERLVQPAVVIPLREEWANVQAAALLLANEANQLDKKRSDEKVGEARRVVREFHHRLCTVRILDPACGSGNFLYVTLEHLKRLEGEVINQLESLGDKQEKLILEGETVTLQQLRGIELNERAASLAELVLWIGYLQWHIRSFGRSNLAEPVVHDYGNIENRDAVLVFDGVEPLTDKNGTAITRWDTTTFKRHAVTGELVPDEAAQVPQWRYLSPGQSQWPPADFIVGNPPFIGAGAMRATLGDGYVEALRATWPKIPESADFVMYWWYNAAEKVRLHGAQRFGLITTNSLRQIFNRRVVQWQQTATPPLVLSFVIPDHPWVDSTDGAAVRIAMSVGQATSTEGRLLTLLSESPTDNGEIEVTLEEHRGLIHSDLRLGANVAGAVELRANGGLTSRGVMLFGAGFIVTDEEAFKLGNPPIIRNYRNGRDLTDKPRGVKVIDAFGLNADQLRSHYPKVYQWLLERVKPERDANRDVAIREKWWLHGRTRGEIRNALAGLPRYIATVETAKHRVFQFLEADVLPDNKLIAIALNDAFYLGVLSSRIHACWALAAGGWLGVGNDPVYVKTRCFETFPFPSENQDTATATIKRLAEQIDAHRKRQQMVHPALTLTGMYNVLEKEYKNEALTEKERAIHSDGLIAVLSSLHDELDAAVLQMYGWDDISLAKDTDQLLERLLALNATRAREESSGNIKWIRPAFQNASRETAQIDLGEGDRSIGAGADTPTRIAEKRAWPSGIPDQIKAVADLVSYSGVSMSLAEIASSFVGRGRWKERIPMILETLESLGRFRKDGSDKWRDAISSPNTRL